MVVNERSRPSLVGNYLKKRDLGRSQRLSSSLGGSPVSSPRQPSQSRLSASKNELVSVLADVGEIWRGGHFGSAPMLKKVAWPYFAVAACHCQVLSAQRADLVRLLGEEALETFSKDRVSECSDADVVQVVLCCLGPRACYQTDVYSAHCRLLEAPLSGMSTRRCYVLRW